MKTINISGLNIDIHDGSISVSISGGADSSLLLYVLMKHHPGPINAIVCTGSSIPVRVYPRYAVDVIHKCIELTNNRNITVHTFFVDQVTTKTLTDGQYKMSKDLGDKILYTGVTAFPDKETLLTFKSYNENNLRLKPVHERRNPDVKLPFYYTNDEVYAPLINVNKRKIAELYSELGIMDSLFPITRSCESLTLIEGHCGNCWWCDERMWAFGKLQ